MFSDVEIHEAFTAATSVVYDKRWFARNRKFREFHIRQRDRYIAFVRHPMNILSPSEWWATATANRKLGQKQTSEIVRRYRTKLVSHRTLARDYNVSLRTIERVLAGCYKQMSAGRSDADA